MQSLSSHSASYTLQASDNGKMVAFTGSATVATLPSPVLSMPWSCTISCEVSTLTITAAGGLSINGSTSSLVLAPADGVNVLVWSDGTNYFTDPSVLVPNNIGAGSYSTTAIALSNTANSYTSLATITLAAGYTTYLVTFQALQTSVGSTNTRVNCQFVNLTGATISSWNSISGSSPTFSIGSVSTISTNYPLIGFTGIMVLNSNAGASFAIQCAPNLGETTAPSYNYFITTVVGLY